MTRPAHHHLDHTSPRASASALALSWGGLAVLLRFMLSFSALLTCLLLITQVTSSHVLPSSSTLHEPNVVVEAPPKLPELLTPQPLPFPSSTEPPQQVPYRFRIPNAEFTLQVMAPRKWGWRALSGDVVRLAPSGPESPEPQSVVTMSAGCFGGCDDLSRNIADALITQLRALDRRGVTARVVHWHVHHASWVEFSYLSDSADGHPQLTGVSVRWESEWLNALRCEMSAPIDLPFEGEDLLHLAWDSWAPLFISRCRDYKVLSWE